MESQEVPGVQELQELQNEHDGAFIEERTLPAKSARTKGGPAHSEYSATPEFRHYFLTARKRVEVRLLHR
jgi:hypothetical protein